MNRIRCRTLFDISRTEVKHAFNQGRLPFVDAQGHTISNHADWLRARNQQRNYETLMQLLSLRTQIQDIGTMELATDQDPWFKLTFTIEDSAMLGTESNPFVTLEQDCAMVPMLIGLSERVTITPMLMPGINVIFESIEY